MTQFYAMQLQEARKMVENLHKNTTQLRTSDWRKVNSLQEEVSKLRIENQMLKRKFYLLKMRLDIYTAWMAFNSQPLILGFLVAHQHIQQVLVTWIPFSRYPCPIISYF